MFLLTVCMMILSFEMKAQSPVTWNYGVKKVNDTVYNVHIAAKIDPGWHLYSQHQPPGAIAIPTKIKFSNNPLLKLTGDVKEIGEMRKYEDEALGISAFDYEEKVDFIQKILLRQKVKTNIHLVVVYQVCNEQKCLPAQHQNFNVELP